MRKSNVVVATLTLGKGHIGIAKKTPHPIGSKMIRENTYQGLMGTVLVVE